MSKNKEPNSTEQLSAQQAADALRSKSRAILDVWCRRATQAKALRSGPLTVALLEDSLPQLLANLANAIEASDEHCGGTLTFEIARKHGAQRFHQYCYTLERIVEEYAILRLVIADILLRDTRWPPSVVARIHEFIDASIRHAAVEFSDLQRSGDVRDMERQRDAASQQRDVAKQQRDAATEQLDASQSLVDTLQKDTQVREHIAALLTHDLGAPLTTISINSQRLYKKAAQIGVTQRLASRIYRAAARMQQMIQDMLDITRLRAGHRLPLKIGQCDLAQVVQDAAQDLADTHGSRMKVTLPTAVAGFWDAAAIARIVDNLATNAIKYGNAESGISIDLKAQTDKVRLSVHNYGKPLSSIEVATVFDPYARTPEAQQGVQRGWGLGLNLVRAMAEAHKGTVGVASDATEGTKFWVELPRDSR